MSSGKLRERYRRLWHFWTGPTAQQIDEATRILSGREYYHLYDELYREVRDAGGSHERDVANAKVRSLVYRDFE